MLRVATRRWGPLIRPAACSLLCRPAASSAAAALPGAEEAPARRLSRHGEVKPGDWTCAKCGANVFARRQECFRCGTPRAYVGDRRRNERQDRAFDVLQQGLDSSKEKKDPAQHLKEMVDKLSRRGRALEALELLRAGRDVLHARPEALSFATCRTMAGLTNIGRTGLAVDLYEDAVRHWAVQPNSFMLLQLSRTAAEGGQAQRAVQLLMAAVRNDIHVLAPRAMGAALQACAQASDSASALELFGLSRAQAGGFSDHQQRDMLASTLSACARARDVPRAERAWALAEASGVAPDLACTNALLHALARGENGRLGQVVPIFERAVRLDERHGADAGHLNHTTVNTALSACARARRADEAFRLQRLAAARGVRADGVTITNLVLACCRDPREAGGRRALAAMRTGLERGIRPDALALQAPPPSLVALLPTSGTNCTPLPAHAPHPPPAPAPPAPRALLLAPLTTCTTSCIAADARARDGRHERRGAVGRAPRTRRLRARGG